MKPLDGLSEYLGSIERRLRLIAVTRGAAVIAAAALLLTVLAVLVANKFAFSNPSVVGARLFLFLGVAFAIAAALIVPVIRLNRRRAARDGRSKNIRNSKSACSRSRSGWSRTATIRFCRCWRDDTLAVASRPSRNRSRKAHGCSASRRPPWRPRWC